MSRHYFLSLAAKFKFKDVLRQIFARGSNEDFQALKKHLARRYGADSQQVFLYGTGRSALAAAIMDVVAHAPAKKPEVIITSLTCYAVVEAVKKAGAEPAFADVRPDTLHFGLDELRACLRKHPDAVAVVIQNNLGHPIDVAPVEKFCRDRHLAIIEDLAHCAGCRYPDGRETGTLGDYTVLSFGKGKSIDTSAGGALVFRRAPLAASAPDHAPRRSDALRARFYPLFGWLARGLSYLHLSGAFVRLLLKMHFIERSADAPLSLETRCAYWQAKLALRELQSLPKNRPPLRDFYRVKDRDEVLSKLQHSGFYFNDTWYDCPVAPVRYYKKAHFRPQDCPVAAQLAKELINFPTHYEKSALDPAREIIKEYLIK